MKEAKTTESVKQEQVPYITRKIDGTVYTVMIHFQPLYG